MMRHFRCDRLISAHVTPAAIRLKLVLFRSTWYGPVTGSEAVTSGPTSDRRCVLEAHRATLTETPSTVQSDGAPPSPRSNRVNGHPVRLAQRSAVADASEGNGVWIGQHVLAPPRPLATRGGVEAPARHAAGRIAP